MKFCYSQTKYLGYVVGGRRIRTDENTNCKRFSQAKFYSSWDLEPDRLGCWFWSRIFTFYIVPFSVCYVLFNEFSIPIYSTNNGYKNQQVVNVYECMVSAAGITVSISRRILCAALEKPKVMTINWFTVCRERKLYFWVPVVLGKMQSSSRLQKYNKFLVDLVDRQ